MKLAWFTPPSEVAVVDSEDALGELVAVSDRAGVAWWIADRHAPTTTEGCGRLEFLEQHGVSPYAFEAREPLQPRLSIERVWLDNVDVELLISQLNSDLYSRYPEPAGRGKKIGSALLAELEHAAASFGVRRFALETGPRQPEAMRVFESAGYVVCEPWGRFVGKDFSICMEKMCTPR